MRFWLIALCLGATFFWTGCDKTVKEQVPFVTYLEIPAGMSTVLTHNFRIEDIPGLSRTDILEAQPAFLRLVVEDGEMNANFIRRVTMNAVTDTSLVEMGYNLDVPIANVRNIDLLPSIVDLKDHITQDGFDITLKIDFRTPPITITRLRVEFNALLTLDAE